MQGALHAAGIHVRSGACSAFDAALAAGKQQYRVAVQLPEAAQHLMGGVGQGDEAVAVAFGVADVNPLAHGVDVAYLQAQPFSEAQAHAVEDEEEYPVAENAGGAKDAPRFFDGDDVGQALNLGRFDQARCHPGFAQDVLVVELEAVQVELDGTPGVRGEQLGEEVGQLRFAQIVDLVVKACADAPDRA